MSVSLGLQRALVLRLWAKCLLCRLAGSGTPPALICNFQKRQMFWPWSVQFTILHRNLDALEESKPCACPLRLPTHPHSGANQIWQYFGIMNMSKIVRRPYLDNAKFQALGKYFVKTSSHTAFRRLSQRRAPVWHWAWTGSEENQTGRAYCHM